MFRPALGRVNRLGIPISSPTKWLLPTLTRKRQYALSSPEYESKSPKPAAKKQKKTKVFRAIQPIPDAPPEPLTEPLIESDFWEYLEPLYSRGWKLSGGQIPLVRGEEEPRVGFVLKRTLRFPSTKDMVVFSENTRSLLLGPIFFRKVPEEFCPELILGLPSVELTRGLVHLAIATESEYQNVVGSNFGVGSASEGPFWIRTFQAAQKMLIKYEKYGPRTLPTLFVPMNPMVRVALPPAPPAVVFPPPSITEADLETYIKPLMTNGWSLGNLPESFASLHGCPALRRVYCFHDYTSARHFFHTVIISILAPANNSYGGAQLQLNSKHPTVEVYSISELAEGAPKKYGISYNNVRFALEVESEFAENWVGGRAKNLAPHTRKLPRTMEELWKGKGLVLSRLPKPTPKKEPERPLGTV
ncbi:hypothetical protein C8R44DRAFT_847153 [Mycena epipterygia]|nr:hypothetical protein C8R44DRAFT_847153 [Mycena epipterygia]